MTSHSYSAVISDLDGTLLNSQHQISDFTRTTLQTLVAAGIKFIVATGRHIVDVQGIRQTMGFACDLITSNGALISAADDSLVVQYTVAPAMAAELVELTWGHAAYETNIYTRNDWLLPREAPELLEFHKDSGFHYTIADAAQLDFDGIHKFCFTGAHEALLKLERMLQERYPDDASIVFSRSDCLEVMAANVNKGNAARRALATFDLKLDDAVAFGDGMNDLELLSMVARGYVMDNASPRLKQALAGHPTAAHCDQDGVAHRLIEIFGL